jgi:hypothetical protein
LGYVPTYIEYYPPVIDFKVDGQIDEYPFHKVPKAIQAQARTIILNAYSWCNRGAPLTRINKPDNRIVQSINIFKVGQTVEKAYFSASWPQELGVVTVAAFWPSMEFYEFASLIVHESMHQALYIREGSLASSTIRPDSLGYSPWKECLRPGIMLWHSFWTFAYQYVFLSESIFEDCRILREEPSVLYVLADMESRILLCRSSLSIFDIVDSKESDKCDKGLAIIRKISEKMNVYHEYSAARDRTNEKCVKKFNEWCRRVATEVSARPSVAQTPSDS